MFKVIDNDGSARLGQMTLRGVTFETPVFMPVGTCGSVKGTFPWDISEKFPIILGNTFHLYLRPGDELIRDMGGLHKFESWPNALLTDSGGYQAFSMSDSKFIEEGVHFKSHLDGSRHFFSPTRSMEIQRNIGADIVMAFDQCLPFGSNHEDTKKAVHRTDRWLRQCAEVKLQEHQSLFGIVQGGFFDDLRKESIHLTSEYNLNGYALGGLAVGEPQAVLHEKLATYLPWMPKDKPRYVMGIGYPEDLVEAVYHGCDMMDCVLPTRNARNGQAFTSLGVVSIKQEQYLKDERPLDVNCDCKVCKNFSRSYLRHLFKAGEMLSAMAMTYHNLHYYFQVMKELRTSIREKNLPAYRNDFLARRTMK